MDVADMEDEGALISAFIAVVALAAAVLRYRTAAADRKEREAERRENQRLHAEYQATIARLAGAQETADGNAADAGGKRTGCVGPLALFAILPVVGLGFLAGRPDEGPIRDPAPGALPALGAAARSPLEHVLGRVLSGTGTTADERQRNAIVFHADQRVVELSDGRRYDYFWHAVDELICFSPRDYEIYLDDCATVEASGEHVSVDFLHRRYRVDYRVATDTPVQW